MKDIAKVFFKELIKFVNKRTVFIVLMAMLLISVTLKWSDENLLKQSGLSSFVVEQDTYINLTFLISIGLLIPLGIIELFTLISKVDKRIKLKRERLNNSLKKELEVIETIEDLTFEELKFLSSFNENPKKECSTSNDNFKLLETLGVIVVVRNLGRFKYESYVLIKLAKGYNDKFNLIYDRFSIATEELKEKQRKIKLNRKKNTPPNTPPALPTSKQYRL